MLDFSAGTSGLERNWLTLPLSSAGVTVNNLTLTGDWGPADRITGINNNLAPGGGQYYTNIQEADTDPRFPTNIPRVGRDASVNFSALQFDLATAC